MVLQLRVELGWGPRNREALYYALGDGDVILFTIVNAAMLEVYCKQRNVINLRLFAIKLLRVKLHTVKIHSERPWHTNFQISVYNSVFVRIKYTSNMAV